MDDETRATIKINVIALGGFKIITSIMILWYFPSWEAVVVIIGLSVPWICAGLYFGGIYSRVRLRLMRVRAKRRQLLWQEWHVDEPAPPLRRR